MMKNIFDRNRINPVGYTKSQVVSNPIITGNRFDRNRINETHGTNDVLEEQILRLRERISGLAKLKEIYKDLNDPLMKQLILHEAAQISKLIADLSLRYHVQVPDILSRASAEILRSDLINARNNIAQNQEQDEVLFDLVDEHQQLFDSQHPQFDNIVKDIEDQLQKTYIQESPFSKEEIHDLQPIFAKHGLSKIPHVKKRTGAHKTKAQMEQFEEEINREKEKEEKQKKIDKIKALLGGRVRVDRAKKIVQEKRYQKQEEEERKELEHKQEEEKKNKQEEQKIAEFKNPKDKDKYLIFKAKDPELFADRIVNYSIDYEVLPSVDEVNEKIKELGITREELTTQLAKGYIDYWQSNYPKAGFSKIPQQVKNATRHFINSHLGKSHIKSTVTNKNEYLQALGVISSQQGKQGIK